MRGTLSRSTGNSTSSGIIPADAGNTRDVNVQNKLGKDHPRGCGEHGDLFLLQIAIPGSSPRMRGTRSRALHRGHVARIIPADAGNTCPVFPIHSQHRDHPRGCGEHATRPPSKDRPPGSSPRMRGTQCKKVSSYMPFGIIPADAGNTLGQNWRTLIKKDHPRGCGEHTAYHMAKAYNWGSSPRMRGTPLDGVVVHVVVGIIPADAGNTKSRLVPEQPRKDHPRGCGEHQPGQFAMAFERGSSPRMRGTRHDDRRIIWDVRIIPADAGNTKLGKRKNGIH